MTRNASSIRPPRRERFLRDTPAELAPGEPFALFDGRRLFMRPVRRDDAERLRRGFARLTPEQVRLRVFYRMTELTPDMLDRMVNFDPERVAAYVATDEDGEIRGEARLFVDRTLDSAEFALIVDPELTGLGVGRRLMRALIDDALGRGLTELWGSVLAENATMLDFCSRLGATREAVPGEPDLVRVRFDLNDPRIARAS